MKIRHVVTIAIALVAALASASPASADTRECKYPRSKAEPFIKEVEARNMSCKTARTIVDQLRDGWQHERSLLYMAVVRGERFYCKYTAFSDRPDDGYGDYVGALCRKNVKPHKHTTDPNTRSVFIKFTPGDILDYA